MSIPTLKHNILSKGKLDYSTKNVRKFWEGKNLTYKYSRTPLFRSPKGNEKKFEIAGLRNNRGSVKGKGKSEGIRSSFDCNTYRF